MSLIPAVFITELPEGSVRLPTIEWEPIAISPASRSFAEMCDASRDAITRMLGIAPSQCITPEFRGTMQITREEQQVSEVSETKVLEKVKIETTVEVERARCSGCGELHEITEAQRARAHNECWDNSKVKIAETLDGWAQVYEVHDRVGDKSFKRREQLCQSCVVAVGDFIRQRRAACDERQIPAGKLLELTQLNDSEWVVKKSSDVETAARGSVALAEPAKRVELRCTCGFEKDFTREKHALDCPLGPAA